LCFHSFQLIPMRNRCSYCLPCNSWFPMPNHLCDLSFFLDFDSCCWYEGSQKWNTMCSAFAVYCNVVWHFILLKIWVLACVANFYFHSVLAFCISAYKLLFLSHHSMLMCSFSVRCGFCFLIA